MNTPDPTDALNGQAYDTWGGGGWTSRPVSAPDPTDTEQLAEEIAEIIREAQVAGRTEYKRRVGFNGRLSIAHAILASDLLAEVANHARREGLAIGWEVGYLRGALDEASDLERADNPYAADTPHA